MPAARHPNGPRNRRRSSLSPAGRVHATGPVRTMKSRVLFFVFATVLLDVIGFGIVIPLLPFYVRSMGGSAEVIGLLLGTFAFTQMIATPLLGRLSDRYGRRPIILASLLGNTVAMVIFAIAAEK